MDSVSKRNYEILTYGAEALLSELPVLWVYGNGNPSIVAVRQSFQYYAWSDLHSIETTNDGKRPTPRQMLAAIRYDRNNDETFKNALAVASDSSWMDRMFDATFTPNSDRSQDFLGFRAAYENYTSKLVEQISSKGYLTLDEVTSLLNKTGFPRQPDF